jgi:anaerobic magnesium-protoporphyrin IX monomethyl ester cyclase
VCFFDAMLAEEVSDYTRVLETERPQVVLLYEDNYNFLSKMCLGTMRRAASRMIAAAREQGARVIAAGPDVTDAPAAYLKAGADFALVGEGLGALLELLPRVEAGPGGDGVVVAHGINGIAVTDAGQTAIRPGSKLLPIAGDVGRAAWDLVDMERYRAMWVKAHGYFSLNMAASRGCPFRCAWCAKPIWGNQYAQRNPIEVADEMGYLKRAFNPDHIWFADDIFGFRVDWVTEFAAAVKADGAGIPFTIQTRADLVGVRMAEALREAGCREAWIGAESGSQRVLDAMNKGTTVAELLHARRHLQDAGIRVGFFIQLGYMGEDLPDILATRELLEAARPDEIGVSVSYPLPGTRFYELVKAQLGGKTRWHESDDLDMMFEGTYSSSFYRSIRNLLHDQVELQSAARADGRELEAARLAIDERWRDLVGRESQFRSRGPSAALG